MRKISRRGITVDICPSCSGIWLDAGELERYIKLRRQDQAFKEHFHPASQIQAYSDSNFSLLGDFLDGADVLLELLDAILGLLDILGIIDY